MRGRASTLAVVALAALLIGPLSEGYAGPAPLGDKLGDLTVGWTFAACGIAAALLRPRSRVGLLLLLTAGAWFLPNFSHTGLDRVDWLAVNTVYLHRGPLVHVLLTHPTGRATSRLGVLTVTAGYAVALTPAWGQDVAAAPLALLVLSLAAVDGRRTRGQARRIRRPGFAATAVTTTVLAGSALLRLASGGDTTASVTRWLVEATFCLVTLGLVAALLGERWRQVSVADMVVELGVRRSDRLRDSLARTLGDPALEIGYRAAHGEGWVDAAGRRLVIPADGDRATTLVSDPHGPVAVLVHDPVVLDDPGLKAAVRAAASLAAANLRLGTEVEDQVAELTRSRRRLLEAADSERGRLAQRLHEGTMRRLDAVAATVAEAGRTARGPRTQARLGPAATELAQTVADLQRWELGLHPRELEELGLEGAVRALAARAPLPVSSRVTLHGVAVPPTQAAAAYFVCSEALANCAKHARASTATIEVGAISGELLVEVRDDGIGGADVARGSGLRSLRDRVETLGGRLVLTSPAGSGTRIVARIPLT